MATLLASFLWPICVLGAEKQQETMRGAMDALAVGRAAFFSTVERGRKTTNAEAHITISGTPLLVAQFKMQTAKGFVAGCFCSF